MDTLDVTKILVLVRKAAVKGYTDTAYGYLHSDFQPKLDLFTKDIHKRIIGGTMAANLAVIKAYDFGRQAYLEKIAV